jgi:hypothetical protein
MANRINVMMNFLSARVWMHYSFRVLAFLALASQVTACNAFGEQKLEGTVWDRATWKPIEGAMVVATYSKLADGFFVTNFASFCHKSAMVMTGPDGKFEFPRDWKYGLPNVVAFKQTYVTAFKPRELPPGARKSDPVLKLNPYKSAMDYPWNKEREKVLESSRRDTLMKDYADDPDPRLVHDPFDYSGCTNTRIAAPRKDRQAWIDLFKAELKEMERLEYPKVMIDGKKRAISSLENDPDPKN